jgi:serine/threonine protein kinase
MEIGLDPSVELVEHAEGSFYHIKLNDAEYKTIAILKHHTTDVLLGLGTRVFKVKKVGDTGDQIYVLKDLWLEKGRKPEHQIYEEIVEDVRDLYSEEDADTIKQHLLTPVDSTIVKVNGIEDDTGTSMLRRHALEPSSNDAQPPIRLPSHDAATCGNACTRCSDMELDAVDDIEYALEKNCRRSHYRVVFKECATPISQVRMMGDVFIVLADLIKGQSFNYILLASTFLILLLPVFRLLHGSGWVHRDISTGNMYLYEGRGLLGDFEFAKNMADHSQPEVRTVRECLLGRRPELRNCIRVQSTLCLLR